MNDCDFCGEEPGTERIMNPNFDDLDKDCWDVCKTCEAVIRQQQKMSIGAVISGSKYGSEYGEKIMSEATEELKNISERTGKVIFSSQI